MSSSDKSPQLWKHQLEAFKRAVGRSFFALFMEQGCGKTAVAIKLLEGGRVLIVCPISTLFNWQREIETWRPEIARYVRVITGTTSQRIKRATKDFSPSSPLILIVNQEALITKAWAAILSFYERIKGRGEPVFHTVVVDESHNFKGHTSQRFKALLPLSLAARNRYILTGTPILNSPIDLWAQFRLLSREVFPGNYFEFRAKYFYDKNASWAGKQGYFPKWEPKKDTFDKLSAIISEHSFRVTKAEALDLPPLVKQITEVELTPKLRHVYDEMHKNFIAELDDLLMGAPDAIMADLAITKTMRLMQICCGILQGVRQDEPAVVESSKLKALEDLLSSIQPAKCIVWTAFTPTYRAIAKVCERLDLSFVSITGGQTPLERQEAIDAFNNDPRVTVCYANQAAGGTGVNLPCSYMIYYSKTFNLAHDLQSEARAHRPGCEKFDKVTRYDIVCKDTIEEEITEALRRKLSIAELILQLRRKYGRNDAYAA